jgi:hypothetical protein
VYLSRRTLQRSTASVRSVRTRCGRIDQSSWCQASPAAPRSLSLDVVARADGSERYWMRSTSGTAPMNHAEQRFGRVQYRAIRALAFTFVTDLDRPASLIY